jgi:hypothetical protein
MRLTTEKIKKTQKELYLLTKEQNLDILSPEVINMKAIEIVKDVMKETDFTNGRLGNAIERNADVVNKRLKQSDLSAGVLAEMLGAMGYKVVVMASSEKTPNGAYVVDAAKIGNAGVPGKGEVNG